MLIKCSHKLLNSPSIIQLEMEPGRFLDVVFTSDRGWREEGGDEADGVEGDDVLGIKLCYLLLHPPAKKKKPKPPRICPPPCTISIPKASTQKRRGHAAAHLKGAKVFEKPPA